MDIPSILNFLGEDHEDYFHAVAPPIIQSSNFCYPTVKALKEAVANESYRGHTS
jgi:cystathionine beta-lyase/cystathionine gamma-synthase